MSGADRPMDYDELWLDRQRLLTECDALAANIREGKEEFRRLKDIERHDAIVIRTLQQQLDEAEHNVIEVCHQRDDAETQLASARGIARRLAESIIEFDGPPSPAQADALLAFDALQRAALVAASPYQGSGLGFDLQRLQQQGPRPWKP